MFIVKGRVRTQIHGQIQSPRKFFSFSAAALMSVSMVGLVASAPHAQALPVDSTWLLKANVGMLKTRMGKAPSGQTNNTVFGKGYIGEISLTKLFTPYLGVQVAGGFAQLKSKGGPSPTGGTPTTVNANKNITMVPLSAFVQLRLPIQDVIVPYVGIGGMYRMVMNMPIKTSTAPVATKTFKLRNGAGIAYQAGVDLFVYDSIGINFDVKWANIKHRATDTFAQPGYVGKSLNVRTLAMTVGAVVPF